VNDQRRIIDVSAGGDGLIPGRSSLSRTNQSTDVPWAKLDREERIGRFMTGWKRQGTSGRRPTGALFLLMSSRRRLGQGAPILTRS